MLRWCLSTLRTLDGHGRNASNIRRLPSGFATIAPPTNSSSLYSAKLHITNHSRVSLYQVAWTPLKLRAPRLHSGRLIHRASVAGKPSHNASHTPTPLALKETIDATSGLASKSSNSVSYISADLSNLPMPSSSFHATTNASSTISTIEKLLSPNTSAKKLSVRRLASLYEGISKQSAINLLGPRGLTSILSICGSLASNPVEMIFNNPLSARYQSDLPKKKLWSFIAQVGSDKVDAGFKLTLEDRYWIMQAHLSKIRASTITKIQPDIDVLRLQYEQIQNLSDAPEVHLPYFNFLISTRNITDAFRSLCCVLQRIVHPDPRFAQFFWDIILQHGSDLSMASQELVCATVLHRVNTVPGNSTQHSAGILTIPSLTEDVIRQGIIRMPHISAAFAAALFPCYNPRYPVQFLSRWAIQQARQAFAPHLPIENRWSNIILLAATVHTKNLPVFNRSLITSSLEPGSNLWITALTLESMNRALANTGSDYGHLCGQVQAVSRPLWSSFLNAIKGQQPVDINRAFVSAFLQVAGKSYDVQLKDECYRFLRDLNLWSFDQNDYWTTKAQAFDIIATYAQAHISCEGRDWSRCFSAISALLPDSVWQEDVAATLIQRYSQENVETAYDLYVHCLEIGTRIRLKTINKLFAGLVRNQRWDIITLFLNHSSTTQDQLQFLFGESLRVFQTKRYRYVDPAFIKLLTLTAFKLYEHQPPPRSLKYPIRYFLSLMIWTRYFQDMVKLANALHRSVPNFFSPSLMRTLTLQLVRQCQPSQALKLFSIFEHAQAKSPTSSFERLRLVLMFQFYKKGAHSIARMMVRGRPQLVSISKREAFARRGLRPLPMPASFYRRVQNIASRTLSDGPTVREAISLLVKANRIFAARKLYARCRSILDTKTLTAIGNIIIHGSFQGSGFRNARLVRRVIKMKDMLVNHYGFVPDRTTLNIILKAILNWKSMLDAAKVRQLFDNMAHAGYPIPEQFRRGHGVPFSSLQGPFTSLPLASLPSGFSFSRHVRPMYKMFIKAFYVRKDVSAAKTVVGILKEVEIAAMRELEKRDQARREGVVKKRLKSRKKIEGVRKAKK